MKKRKTNLLQSTIDYARRTGKIIYTLNSKIDPYIIIQSKSKNEAQNLMREFPDLFFYCASKPNGIHFIFSAEKGKTIAL